MLPKSYICITWGVRQNLKFLDLRYPTEHIYDRSTCLNAYHVPQVIVKMENHWSEAVLCGLGNQASWGLGPAWRFTGWIAFSKLARFQSLLENRAEALFTLWDGCEDYMSQQR